ncbi:MFS transporter [Chitiniphilus shinanonensis]|uniref:MFS transporter n=1 Tax=Chitiniphilus shinanonensis TaxID=553088 RepID=UPI00302CA374
MSQTHPPLTSRLVALMAFATGLTVASNYYAQPLLGTLATAFGMSEALAGFIVTTAQLGYALGLVFLVPLGDVMERRGLIVGMTLLAACGLAITASAHSVAQILVGTALTGLFVVVAQVLVPLGATLAAPDQRGRVVGTLMSGLLLGILLARTAAGLLAELGGWRTVYWVAAPLLVVTALALWRALPTYREPASMRYPQLLASVLRLFVDVPALRLRATLGAFSFAIFSVLWTSMAFLLSEAPFHFSEATIGLFGLVGAAGALAASGAGRMADRGGADRTTTVGLVLLLLSWLPIAVAQRSLAAFVVGVLVLDLAVQAVHVSNQSVLYKLRPDARSRMTAAYMTSYFIGGAAGSLLSASAYHAAGWYGVCIAGGAISLAALLTWGLSRVRKPAMA